MSLKTLGTREHNPERWTVEFHEEFLQEFASFSEAVREETYALIKMLEERGPQLGRPHADTLKGAKRANLKELRFRADDGVWRIAFAFDARRNAILLVGGDKSGRSQDRFYRGLIEIAEKRFIQHQKALTRAKEE